KGRPIEAAGDFDRALEGNPSNAMAWAARGAALLLSGQLDRGIAALDRSIAGGSDPVAYSLRGRALVAKGQVERGIADFDQALKLNPHLSDALVGRALAWTEKGSYERALADIDDALTARENIEGLYVRAQIYERQGKTDRAMADLKKAIDLAASNAFEVVAQANARKRLEQLAKLIPCGNISQAGDPGTCL